MSSKTNFSPSTILAVRNYIDGALVLLLHVVRDGAFMSLMSNLFVTSVDGGWSGFEAWSQCSAECGGGSQTRSRFCSNPAPAFGGAVCDGNAQESRECNTQPCPGSMEILVIFYCTHAALYVAPVKNIVYPRTGDCKF